VLGNLSAPETLGPAISGAFIATLYGVGSANVVYFPVCYSLQMLSSKEVEERTLIVEGILAIQAGDNPRIVAQKLLSFIAPEERDAIENAGKKPDLKVAEPAAEAA
jgi:chemotaxis protein MotA